MKINVEQGTDEWLAIRAGKITASKIKNIVAGNSTTSYKNVIADLVAERMSGNPIVGYSNAYMDRGNELEDEAVSVYETEKFTVVDRVGFIVHKELDYAGCSPDGLVGKDGMIQVKCHKAHIHLNYILNGTVPKEYVRQIQWELETSERLWSDFVSYCPDFPSPHNLWVKRIDRDNDMIADIKREVISTDKYVNDIIKLLYEKD